jgi:hypothetical protein
MFPGDPAFQYIITTTTAPPRTVATEPYFRQTLNALEVNG